MKRYVGGAPRIKEEDKQTLADDQDAVKVVMSILEQCVERQEEAVLSATIDTEVDQWQLVAKRLRLEGARTLINDAKQAITQTLRS